jgi:cobalt/nickel transport protein
MTRFLLSFGLVALIVAGGLSYLADSDPDGLESVSRQGCTVVDSPAGERLDGSCVATHAREHPLVDWPFAGYTIGGDGRTTGLAGALGVLATLAVAAGLFRLLRRRPARPPAGGRSGELPGHERSG